MEEFAIPMSFCEPLSTLDLVHLVHIVHLKSKVDKIPKIPKMDKIPNIDIYLHIRDLHFGQTPIFASSALRPAGSG
jgi:hypothetical protein